MHGSPSRGLSPGSGEGWPLNSYQVRKHLGAEQRRGRRVQKVFCLRQKFLISGWKDWKQNQDNYYVSTLVLCFLVSSVFGCFVTRSLMYLSLSENRVQTFSHTAHCLLCFACLGLNLEEIICWSLLPQAVFYFGQKAVSLSSGRSCRRHSSEKSQWPGNLLFLAYSEFAILAQNWRCIRRKLISIFQDYFRNLILAYQFRVYYTY